MAKLNTGYPIIFKFGGDVMHDFAEKYIREIERIYYFLNKVRMLDPENTYDLEPSAGQLGIIDNKLCVRNEENTEWIYLGDLKYNFGFTTSPDERVLTTNDLTTVFGDVGKIPITDETGRLPCNITGDAGRLGGYGIKTVNIRDGQGLFYRDNIHGWQNELKGVVGSGKTLTVRDGDKVLAVYNGDKTVEFDIGLTAQNALIDSLPVDVQNKLDAITAEAEQYLHETGNTARNYLDGVENKVNNDLSEHNTSDAAHEDIREAISVNNAKISAMRANLYAINGLISVLKNKMNLVEEWEASKQYERGAVIAVGEETYCAINTTQGDYPPDNADKWQLITMPTRMWEFDEYGDIMPFDEATGANPVAFAFEYDGEGSIAPYRLEDV